MIEWSREWKPIESAPAGQNLALLSVDDVFTGSYVRESNDGRRLFTHNGGGYAYPSHWDYLPNPLAGLDYD
jgi:hypothetical protein